MGLGHRYGRRMQTISGIHYNWSLPGLGNDEYFALIRNFRRHSFLLLYLFGASPAVCSSFVAGREHESADAVAAHAAPAARHLAAHGAAGLPERRAGLAGGQLQQPGQLRRVAARGADPALSALRGDRHPQPRRRIQPAGHQPAADRERVLRHDPAQARDPPRRAPAARAARARRRVRRGALHGPRPLRAGGHRGVDDALHRPLPAALPARRQPARHAATRSPRWRATSSARRRAAASPG